jgi:hypothetical protein
MRTKLIRNVVEMRVKNPAAVALGKLGGQKGGKARARSLSAKERSAIARKGAEARARKLSPAARSEIARRAGQARQSSSHKRT